MINKTLLFIMVTMVMAAILNFVLEFADFQNIFCLSLFTQIVSCLVIALGIFTYLH